VNNSEPRLNEICKFQCGLPVNFDKGMKAYALGGFEARKEAKIIKLTQLLRFILRSISE
jgi:hypothetical protein